MILVNIERGGLHFTVDVNQNGKPRLIHFSSEPFDESTYNEHKYSRFYTLLELHGMGFDINDHHASKHIHTSPGAEMKYISHTLQEKEAGACLIIRMGNGSLTADMHYQFYDAAAVVRCKAVLTNHGDEPFAIDYISSFAYYGLSHGCENWDQESWFYIPHNTWHTELQWRKNTPWELGLSRMPSSSLKKLHYSQTGTWSTSEYLPIGVYTIPKNNAAIYWQIEHNGSWYWETSDTMRGGLYIQAGGPNYEHNHFLKTLQPGESFETVPVAAGSCRGGFDEAIGQLTVYRRLIRRPNEDNETLPVIFNDYMNCLMGDPTTERLLPLIAAAADAGSEYFVVDAGWFAPNQGGDGSWWGSLGTTWEESQERFPNGFSEVFDAIRDKGMKPGLWLELENIGKDSPLASTLPDEWFFQLGGKRVLEHYRYQLDWRHPDVRRYADDIVDKVIEKYQLKYIKLDYNINASIGTDYNAESPGSGLLEHCRAFLSWLDAFFERHPDVVIENCASGGQRMDYAMLSRLSIQSTSDQTDYRQYASISAMASSAVTPEQAAVWSYPHWEGDEEQTAFNMINAMLGRIHLSGFLYRLSARNQELVREGVACYKLIRQDLKKALPVYPLGLISFHSAWAASGLKTDNKLYLSVWRRQSEQDTITIPLSLPKKQNVRVSCLYPKGLPVSFGFDESSSCLTVTLPQCYSARFFEISWQ